MSRLSRVRSSDSTPSNASKSEKPSGSPEPSQAPEPLAPGLYIVSTPIGNLSDITLRALDILQRVDAVACEDTRVTGKLLAAHGVTRPMLTYHEHNAARRRPEIIRRIESGESVALVADAGTPLISDPGYKLVRALQEAGLPVTAVPGPSAAPAALVVSGLPSDRFFFQGFLPARTKGRRDTLRELSAVDASLVFYESPKRLPAALADMADVLGPREAAVVRELTKRFEEVRRAPLAELAAAYESETPRGEIVVVVAPPAAGAREVLAKEIDARLRTALTTLSLRDAVSEVAQACGLPRNRVYQRALALKEERG